MINRKASVSILYQLSMIKQAADGTLSNLTEQQKELLINAKEGALEKWFEVDIAVRQAKDLGAIPNWIKSSVSKLIGPTKKLNTITVSAGYTETHDEFVKQAQLFNKLLNEYSKIQSNEELLKEAGAWDSFKKGVGDLAIYGGKLVIIYQFLEAIYNVYFVYEQQIDSILKKYKLNITSWETISNPLKIKQSIITNKQNPELVLALIKIADAAKGWLLSVLDIILGSIDIITDILGVGITGATFGIGTGAAFAINASITLLSLVLSLYAGPVAVQRYYRETFAAAEKIANENIQKLQTELKTLKPSLEDIMKSFEEEDSEEASFKESA